MLLIKTEVHESAIDGLGLFAAEPVDAGQAVWRFTHGLDLDLDPGELDKLLPYQRQQLLHYGYIDKHTGRFILCCDDARFINHSPRPNIASDYTHERHGVDLAVRDIDAGEEITIDYRQLEA